uniref:Gem-associated protein 8 n=1 Tax=Lygus hesperus TaxID=30085 RepID=A0A146MD98_LYGHE
MKIKNTEPSLTPKKLTKQRRKSKKSRAAKEARKRRRKLKAARNREPSKWRPVETSSHPKPVGKAPFVVRQGLSAMSGNWYWLNYYNVFQWKDHHLSKRGVTAYTLPWQNMWPADGRVASIGGAEACGSGLQCTADSCEPVTDTSATTVDDDCDEDYVDKEEVASDVESDEDIVVTEEMMQFLEISMRHKASKNEEKEAKKQIDKALEDERNASEDCLLPSDEADNEKRHAEMVLLYGEKAPMIHGMETAQQLTFNRQVDLYNPPYWPILPFTFQFKS